MPVAVVTDSTAYLPSELVDAHDITVVPLAVVISGREGREGVDVSPQQVIAALHGRRVDVTTSRPAPADFAAAYRRCLDAGATAVLSVHLSAGLSGTWESARLAAADFAGAVEVVDSRSTGMGLGFPVLAAARAAAAGGDLAQVRAAADTAIGGTTTLFYVDTLEFLRRGGRIGAASALLGTALAVKPILLVRDGQVVLREKVRTASRALGRLVDLAVEAAGDGPAGVAVHHHACPGRAADLLERMRERLGDRLAETVVTEVGPVVAAHVGPGLACVVVHSRSAG